MPVRNQGLTNQPMPSAMPSNATPAPVNQPPQVPLPNQQSITPAIPTTQPPSNQIQQQPIPLNQSQRSRYPINQMQQSRAHIKRFAPNKQMPSGPMAVYPKARRKLRIDPQAQSSMLVPEPVYTDAQGKRFE